jgi:hypothetical protein
VTELRSLLAALDSSPGFSVEGSVLEDRSSGSFQVDKAGRMFAEVLRSPSGEAVVPVGPQLLSTQEIDFLPMANRVELVVRSAWDCFEVDHGFTVTPQVKAVALGRRKKRKQLGFLGLGLGFGNLGLGLSGFAFGSGPGLVSNSVFGSGYRSAFGLGSRSVVPISGSDIGSIAFSRPDLAESSMVADEQVRLVEAALMVFDGEEAALTMCDEQFRFEESTSMVSDCSDECSGTSTVSSFFKLCR